MSLTKSFLLVLVLGLAADAHAQGRNPAQHALRMAERSRSPRDRVGWADAALRRRGLTRYQQARAFYLRGHGYYMLERMRYAIADMRCVVARDPRNAHAYGLAGHAHMALGERDLAASAYQAAYRASGDRSWLRRRDAARQRPGRRQRTPAQRRTRYRLVFVGYAVDRIMKDSLFHPANEYYFMAGIGPGNARSYGRAYPSRGAFQNNKPGTRRRIGATVWRGADTDLRLRLALFEHDNGGAAVEVATYYGLMALAKAAGARAGVGAVPPGQPIGSKMSAPRWITGPLKKVFGATHDHMGTLSVRLQPSAVARMRLVRHRGFVHHFRATYKSHGAIVHAYYRVIAE